MNLIDLQDKLKNLSEQQLIQEMQMPTGQTPQFLLLSEITRRKKMRDAFAQEQMKDGTTTVAQDMVAAAGMPTEFAGQMAGTMAPQTDMAGNTGAMPQQSAMPAPVQAMAGGGIVALQEGGSVSNTPRLVVRGGRQFAEMPDGSLVPLSALGFDEAELSGAGGADLTAPGSGVRQGPIPSQSDLDRRFRDEAVGISGVPARLPAYGADSFMDAYLPGTDVTSAPQLSGLQAPMDRDEAVRPRQGVFTGEDMAFGTGSPLAPQPAAMAPVSPTQPEAEGRMLPWFLRMDPEAESGEAIERLLFPNRDPEEIRARRRAEREGTPPAAPEAPPSGDGLLPPDEPVAPIDVAPTSTPPMVGAGAAAPAGAGASGGAGGGGGGIAAVAQGAGTPSDYEQELIKMLQARDKRATQDKWLALAQAGMALMSSKDPTFGGALGEAGQVGLGALREGQSGAEADRLALLGQLEQSRMGREKMDLERQALAARSAARGSGGRPIPASVLTAVNRQITDLQAQLPMAMGNPAQRDAIEQEIRRLNTISNQVLSTYGLGAGMAEDAGYDLDLQ